MKINKAAYPLVEYTARSVKFTDEIFRNSLYMRLAASKFNADREYFKEYRIFINDLATTQHIKSYLIAKTVTKYLVNHGMPLMQKMWPFMASLPENTGAVLLDDFTCFYRTLQKETETVVLYYALSDKESDIGLVRQKKNDKSKIEAKLRDDSNLATSMGMITAMLILPFLTFAECETKIINSETQHKVKINKEKYVSDIPEDLEIVDSNWFTTIIRSEGFNVNGHFRLQPIGALRTGRKLIWIKDFEKHGYTRKAHLEKE